MQTTREQAVKMAQECQSAVNAYLMARTLAEATREQVDKIHREILAECPIYDDLTLDGKRTATGRAITKSADLYLSEDEDACQDFYTEADIRLRRAGIKPANMPQGHCPALVAEHLQIQTENLLIECALEAMGEPKENRAYIYLEKRRRFIDLICGLVVNQEGYKNPLTKELVTT